MRNDWQPKPGDKIVRRPRVKAHPLRRVLGIPGLYSVGYGNVGSSIYYALGIIVLVAMGATPIVLAVAGILFIFTALTYAEGTAMYPEAGGSASFARHGFNDSVGFISGWALMLGYIVTIAISAFVIPPYLGYFWPPLKESAAIGTAVSMGIIFFVMIINVIGVRETSFVNVAAAVFDLLVQLLIICLGFLVLFNFDFLVNNIRFYWPSWENLFLGVALASIAYTGVETMSQMAEETKRPAKKVPRALVLMIITVLILFGGVSTVGLSAMTPPELAGSWATDPVAGIAHAISMAITPQEMAATLSSGTEVVIVLTWIFTGLRDLLPLLVAVLAASILFIATNAGLMGISRLAFSMGRNQLIPAALGRVHHRFKTPYISIIIFSAVALAIMVPGFFAPRAFLELGALYAFGSLLSFVLAHASIMSLRIKNPDLPRPFRLRWNIRFRQRELPVTAILGLVGTAAVWLVVIFTQPYSRWVGFGWMAVGLVIYVIFRWRRKLYSNKIAGTPTGPTESQR
ncbi:MAG: APC family permease [Chloroflexi bacterium]|nr:APC family permease [Chloroflexota bacterium]